MAEFDQQSWEARWSNALREHGDRVAERPPNAHLTAELAALPPGHALDAGCGHGAETIWLADRGWSVTALDFSATALAYARSRVEPTARIDWVEADLTTWTPERGAYDLVASVYVHIAGSIEEFVRRLASGVAAGGTLFLVGRRQIDQVQVSVESTRAALDPARWELLLAEERTGAGGVDAVIRARAR